LKKTSYFLQTQLLIQILPYIAEEPDFALKGGTAINLFIRDLPRLSIDIDLTYLPLKNREETLQSIHHLLSRVAQRIRTKISGSVIQEMRPFGATYVSKLSVNHLNTKIIIEPNLILRGSVYPNRIMSLSKETERLFMQAVSMQVMSFADLYGGKICAALDRQHPRDLFDVKILLENEGIAEQTRKAFIVYLISGDRPIHEMLNPNRIDICVLFNEEFKTMNRKEVNYDTLLETRELLIKTIHESLTDTERKFLISVKSGNPEWTLLNIPGVEKLPGIRWKLMNIQKMDIKKREKQLDDLKAVLYP